MQNQRLEEMNHVHVAVVKSINIVAGENNDLFYMGEVINKIKMEVAKCWFQQKRCLQKQKQENMQ